MIKKIRVIQICLLIFFIFIWSACVDVKIASVIPEVKYLSLHIPESSNTLNCKKMQKIGLLDIYALPPFDSNSLILYDLSTLEVSEIKDKKWINSPKDMLKLSLIQKLQSQCYQVSIQPFGTQKLDKILKISLLSLQVLEDKGSYYAQMSVFYEIFEDGYRQSKSGTITHKVALQSLQDENFALSFVKLNNQVLDSVLANF